MITAEQIQAISPKVYNLDVYLNPLNEAMREFEINTANRVRAFLSQILHESDCFIYMKEEATGQEYEGRKDLGNTQIGDGVKYKGRGPLEITGRDNYRLCGLALGLDLLSKPELLEDPQYGFKASAWWWKMKGLNEIADHPEKSFVFHNKTYNNFQYICIKINGGLNGYENRLMFFEKAKKIIL